MFAEKLQSGKAVSHGNRWHPGMESDGHDEVADASQPVDAGIHVLSEETTDRLLE